MDGRLASAFRNAKVTLYGTATEADGHLPVLAEGYLLGVRRGLVLLSDRRRGPVCTITKAELVGQVARQKEEVRGGKILSLLQGEGPA